MTQQLSPFLVAVEEFQRRSESCANYAARVTREHPHDDEAEHEAINYYGRSKAYKDAATYLNQSVDPSNTFKEAVAQMRSLQKEYFDKRDFNILTKARKAERVVDRLLAEMFVPESKTGDLFLDV